MGNVQQAIETLFTTNASTNFPVSAYCKQVARRSLPVPEEAGGSYETLWENRPNYSVRQTRGLELKLIAVLQHGVFQMTTQPRHRVLVVEQVPIVDERFVKMD